MVCLRHASFETLGFHLEDDPKVNPGVMNYIFGLVTSGGKVDCETEGGVVQHQQICGRTNRQSWGKGSWAWKKDVWSNSWFMFKPPAVIINFGDDRKKEFGSSNKNEFPSKEASPGFRVRVRDLNIKVQSGVEALHLCIGEPVQATSDQDDLWLFPLEVVGHVQLGGDPGVDPELTEDVTHAICSGDTLDSPWRTWRNKCLGLLAPPATTVICPWVIRRKWKTPWNTYEETWKLPACDTYLHKLRLMLHL